jgi:two-component system NtrC family sensor kinase
MFVAPFACGAQAHGRGDDAMNAPTHGAEDSSIRWLQALLAISVLAPLLVFVASTWLDYRQTLALASQRVDRTLRIADEHAQHVFETSVLVLDRVDDVLGARSAQALRADGALPARLGAVVRDVPAVQGVWVLDAQGRLVVAGELPGAAAAPGTGPGAAGDEALRRHAAGSVGVVVSSGGGGGPARPAFFSVSKGRLVEGGLAGAVGVTLDPAELDRLYRQLVQEHPDIAVRVYDADGSVVTDVVAATAARPRTPGRLSPVVLAAESRSGVHVGRDGTGEAELLAFAPVDGFGLYVGAALPLRAVEREWVGQTLLTLAFALAATVTLGAMSWTALRRAQKERAVRRQWHIETTRRTAAEKALRESQRMEAMGQLTGGVAHDFNNLLMVVSGNLQILRRREGMEAHERQLDAMAQAVQRGTTLTRHLLAFSRRQALTPSAIDLDEAMPALCELLSHSLRENMRLSCHVAPGTWPVQADRAELELALLNIAVNARDAMPAGGTLTVAVRNATVDDLVSLGGSMAGEFVLISVHDTGEGIPAEVLPRVFEPFFTTKPPGRGTGLGLSQVYGFSRQSGGTVTLQSPPGRGTTVTLWLPRSLEAPVAAALPATPSEPQGAGNILVVEDDATVSGVLAELLEELGFTVATAASGTAALEKLHAGPRVDLLLTDVVMLGPMNGLQLARTVRSRFPAMPVIVMTGYAAEMTRIGAEGFRVLTKPFDLATLSRAIESAMAQRRQPAAATPR